MQQQQQWWWWCGTARTAGRDRLILESRVVAGGTRRTEGNKERAAVLLVNFVYFMEGRQRASRCKHIPELKVRRVLLHSALLWGRDGRRDCFT